MNSLQKSLSGPMLKHKHSLYLGIPRQQSHGRTNKIFNQIHHPKKIRPRQNSLPSGLRVLEKDKCLSLATQRLLTYRFLLNRLPTLTSPRIAAIEDDDETKQYSNSPDKNIKFQEDKQIDLHPPVVKVEQEIKQFQPKDSLHTSPNTRLINKSPVGCQEIYLKYFTKDLKKKKTQLIKSTLTTQERLSKLMTHKAATFQCLPQLVFSHVDAKQFEASTSQKRIQKAGSLLVKGSRSFIIHPSPTTQKHSFLTTHIPAKSLKEEFYSTRLKTRD